jgi:hypothetical protein
LRVADCITRGPATSVVNQNEGALDLLQSKIEPIITGRCICSKSAAKLPAYVEFAGWVRQAVGRIDVSARCYAS